MKMIDNRYCQKYLKYILIRSDKYVIRLNSDLKNYEMEFKRKKDLSKEKFNNNKISSLQITR